jgi:hypothetical protein
MSRRRRHPPPPAPAKTRSAPFHAPFEGSARSLRAAPEGAAAPAPSPCRQGKPRPSPRRAAERRRGLVRRRDGGRPAAPRRLARRRARAGRATPRTVVDEDAEALAVLSDLVAGNGDFDISDSTEYVEGAVVGFDPRV